MYKSLVFLNPTASGLLFASRNKLLVPAKTIFPDPGSKFDISEFRQKKTSDLPGKIDVSGNTKRSISSSLPDASVQPFIFNAISELLTISINSSLSPPSTTPFAL